MDVAPIVSAMRRHKIAVSLIVLEIALSCAIICNLLFLINERLQRLQIDSGVAETELIRIQAANPGSWKVAGEPGPQLGTPVPGHAARGTGRQCCCAGLPGTFQQFQQHQHRSPQRRSAG